MTEQLNHSRMHELSDSELLNAVRNGDQLCFGVLWERHRQAAEYAARSITSTFEPDDLVQESFARIYSALVNGKGPTNGFRAYMYATLRSVSISWASKYEATVDISTQENHLFADEDLADLTEDKRLTVTAFQGLPQDWKTVLWYTEIEGMTPAEIAPLLGIAPRAVSALAFRAREGLRENWLKAHINKDARAESEECQWAEQYLAAYARDSLSAKRTARMQEHLADCSDCSLLLLELTTVGESLKGALLPLVLGLSPAAAALWSTSSVVGGASVASGGAAGAVGSSGLAAGMSEAAGSTSGAGVLSSAGNWFAQLKDKAAANPSLAVAGGLGAGLVVVAVGVAAALSLGGQDSASAVPSAASSPRGSATHSAPSDRENAEIADESPANSDPSVEQSSPLESAGADEGLADSRPTESYGSEEPSDGGGAKPSSQTSSDPDDEPSTEPTSEPTGEPSSDPTDEPTTDPSGEPTTDPTDEPTAEPAPLAVMSESVANSQVMPRFSGTGEPGSTVQVFLADSLSLADSTQKADSLVRADTEVQAVSPQITVGTDGTWQADVSTDAPTTGSQRYVVKNSVDGVVVSTVNIATTYDIVAPTKRDFQVCKVYEAGTYPNYVDNGGVLYTDTELGSLTLLFSIVTGASGTASFQFNSLISEPLSLTQGAKTYKLEASGDPSLFAPSNTVRMRHMIADPAGNRYGPWLDVFGFSLAPSAQGENSPIADDCV